MVTNRSWKIQLSFSQYESYDATDRQTDRHWPHIYNTLYSHRGFYTVHVTELYIYFLGV